MDHEASTIAALAAPPVSAPEEQLLPMPNDQRQEPAEPQVDVSYLLRNSHSMGLISKLYSGPQPAASP